MAHGGQQGVLLTALPDHFLLQKFAKPGPEASQNSLGQWITVLQLLCFPDLLNLFLNLLNAREKETVVHVLFSLENVQLNGEWCRYKTVLVEKGNVAVREGVGVQLVGEFFQGVGVVAEKVPQGMKK